MFYTPTKSHNFFTFSYKTISKRPRIPAFSLNFAYKASIGYDKNGKSTPLHWHPLRLGRPVTCGNMYVKHFAEFSHFFETQCWQPCRNLIRITQDFDETEKREFSNHNRQPYISNISENIPASPVKRNHFRSLCRSQAYPVLREWFPPGLIFVPLLSLLQYSDRFVAARHSGGLVVVGIGVCAVLEKMSFKNVLPVPENNRLCFLLFIGWWISNECSYIVFASTVKPKNIICLYKNHEFCIFLWFT